MTGAAWLPSARAVRCSVKSSNERNPFQMLNFSSETARVNREEGGDDVKSAWPLTPWATHMLQWEVTKGSPSRKTELIPSKLLSVRIEGCNSPS